MSYHLWPYVVTEWASLIWVTSPHVTFPMNTAISAVVLSQGCSTHALLRGFERKTQNLHLIWVRYTKRQYLKPELSWLLHPGLRKEVSREKEKNKANGHMCRGEGWESKMAVLACPWLYIFSWEALFKLHTWFSQNTLDCLSKLPFILAVSRQVMFPAV